MFNVKINGVSAVIAGIDKFEGKVLKGLADKLNNFGLGTVRDAMSNAPGDEGKLKGSISATVATPTDLKVTVSVGVFYAAYVEFGTRKFAAAEVAKLPQEWKVFAAQFKGKGQGDYYEFLNNILDWVKRKGIASRYSVKTRKAIPINIGGKGKASKSDQDNLERVAYGIALYIMRNGIRPHPYLIPAVEKNRIELIRSIKAGI